MRRVAGAVVLLVSACAHEQEQPTRVAVFVHEAPPPPPPAPENKSREPLFGGEAVSATVAPLPIHGGTLLIAGPYVWVASPDAGVVDVVDIESRAIVHSFALGAGSQPGRLAEDSTGAVAVVLRGEGAVARLVLPSKTIEKKKVCGAPRGVAFAKDKMHVACATGDIVTLSPSGAKTTTTSSSVGGDLRDIASDTGGTIYVTRMRRSEILVLDSDLNVQRTLRPREATDEIDRRQKWHGRFIPHVAWKMERGADGSVVVLHQYEATREVPTESPPVVDRFVPVVTPYGGVTETENLCGDGKLIVPAITKLQNGAIVGSARLGNGVHGTPFDFTTVGHRARLLHTDGTLTLATLPFSQNEPSCVGEDADFRVFDGTPIAVASSIGFVAVQERDPDMLVMTTGTETYKVKLSTTSPRDTGWKLFHETTESGIACMTCHPEGNEDGHTWSFTGVGQRRTQSLRGGLLATAPFHWSGDMDGMEKLTREIFMKRMGGAAVSEPQAKALGSWLDRLPAPTHTNIIDAGVAARGRTIFESSGCASCHSGSRLTNNDSADVGTGGLFQVPSLVGLSARAPYMHDGCASTLAERFTLKDCGGSDHGNVKSLKAHELYDLVGYLSSL